MSHTQSEYKYLAATVRLVLPVGSLVLPVGERQAQTTRNQSLVQDVCKTSLACSTLGSTAAMLTMVNCVKTLTKSVAVSLLNNQNRTQAGQGTWKCGLPPEFIDEDQMTLQELMSLKRMPHTTLDGNHHN